VPYFSGIKRALIPGAAIVQSAHTQHDAHKSGPHTQRGDHFLYSPPLAKGTRLVRNLGAASRASQVPDLPDRIDTVRDGLDRAHTWVTGGHGLARVPSLSRHGRLVISIARLRDSWLHRGLLSKAWPF
jgi:hypothetical protein